MASYRCFIGCFRPFLAWQLNSAVISCRIYHRMYDTGQENCDLIHYVQILKRASQPKQASVWLAWHSLWHARTNQKVIMELQQVRLVTTFKCHTSSWRCKRPTSSPSASMQRVEWRHIFSTVAIDITDYDIFETQGSLPSFRGFSILSPCLNVVVGYNSVSNKANSKKVDNDHE